MNYIGSGTGTAWVTFMLNYEDFRADRFGKETIKPQSKLIAYHTNLNQASYSTLPISLNKIEDETAFLNLG